MKGTELIDDGARPGVDGAAGAIRRILTSGGTTVDGASWAEPGLIDGPAVR